jgi:hypothetical protein
MARTMDRPGLGTPERVRRKGGRPRKALAEQLRGRISVGLNDAMYERLRQAAHDNARTVSGEVADRLAASFGSVAAWPEPRLVEWIEQTAPPPAAVRALYRRLLEALPDEGDRRRLELFVTAPLGRAIQIGGAKILTPGVLDRFADRLGCTRWEAVQWWTDMLKAVLPYVAEPYVETAAAPEQGAEA